MGKKYVIELSKLDPYEDPNEAAEKAWDLAGWIFRNASDSDLADIFPDEWIRGYLEYVIFRRQGKVR